MTSVDVDLGTGSVRLGGDFAAVAGFPWPEAAGDPAALATALGARVAGHDRARVLHEAEAALHGEAASGLIAFEIVDAAAGSRRLECAWSIERGSAGAARRLFVACTHVPEPAAAEVRGRESEERYRTALQAGRMGTWETDFDTMTRTWSPEAMALFGLDLPGGRGRVGGANDEYRNALHPSDRHLAERYRALADREDSFEAEYRVVRPDGRTSWLAGRGLVVARGADGRARRLVSIMADITERRLAEEHLRIERERLQLALDAGQMGAFDLDIPADVLWWSPGMYAVFGHTPESFTPTRESVLTLLHPDDRAGFVQGRKRAIAERRPFVHEFRAVRPDGQLAWIAHIGRSEYDDAGRPVRTYGITMNVTERRLQEEALRQADRQKDRFIATLAHELRNPLAPIRNAVEWLRRSAGADAQLAWHRDVIDRQVTQMAHLLDDLLDVSRITQGRIRLRRGVVALAAAIEQAIEVAAPLMASHGHRLEVALPAEPLLVDADALRLAQVFSNLLVNAAKYTPPGGRIALSLRRDGAEAVVSVADDGLGIAAEQMPRLFEMFGQGEPGADRAHGGLGIGLWLARALVGLHDGRIEARSEGLGRGSEFVVRLPLAQAVQAAQAAAPPAERRTTGSTPPPRLRILVADDKADMADSLAALLGIEGHAVHVAYNGLDALEAARSFRPQAAVLDLGMPGRDGYEVCRALRAEPWGSDLTLIALTGWGQAEHRRRSQEAGFDHHVVKPVDPRELIALLQQRRGTG